MLLFTRDGNLRHGVKFPSGNNFRLDVNATVSPRSTIARSLRHCHLRQIDPAMPIGHDVFSPMCTMKHVFCILSDNGIAKSH